MIYSTNILKKLKVQGGYFYWQMYAEEDATGVYTQTKFWQDTANNDSTIQTSEPSYIQGKNIGRANETTPQNQAILEIKSLEKKKRDEGFSEDGKSSEKPLAMLAKNFYDEIKKVIYPVYVQEKQNGCRNLSNGTDFWSRKGIDYIPQVVEHLKFFNKYNFVWDGELLLPDNQPLQTVNKAIKKVCPENRDLIYVLYDVMTDEPYSKRFTRVKKLVEQVNNKNIIVCPTWVANNEAELLDIHKKLVSQGKEGSIVRWGNEGYLGNLKRSSNLLKLKDFQDDEFIVENVRDGVGKMKGHAILQLLTHDFKSFEAVPEGTMERRKEIFDNKDKHIGKLWTVRFFNYSLDNIPVFPVAVDLREDL